MFRSKVQQEEPGLLLLQKNIARDRLRLQQRLELVGGDRPVEEISRGTVSGRLYEVFVAMGEAQS